MSKRLKFLVIALTLCICGVACLCSFAPPSVSWDTYEVSSLTITDVENLIAVCDFQAKYGSFNGYVPIACHVSGSSIRLYSAPSDSTWTIVQEGNTYTLTSSAEGSRMMRTIFSATGFAMQYTGNGATITNVLFYRNTNGDFVRNPDYAYATGTDNDVIADCAAMWYEAFKVVNGYESALEEAESEGYENGYNYGFVDGLDQGFDNGYGEGESDGYANGYTSGYNQGQFDGLGQGFDLGYADGITDGYESGYDRGYAEGYIDGYDTGVAEGGGGGEPPVIDPTFELDIPEIFDGMANGVTGILSAFDIEIFGINIVGLLIALLVIAIVGFIIRKMVK